MFYFLIGAVVQVPDFSEVDLYGNALLCMCLPGYLKEELWPTTVGAQSGDWPRAAVVGFSCIQAFSFGANGLPTGVDTAWRDGHAAVRAWLVASSLPTRRRRRILMTFSVLGASIVVSVQATKPCPA
jgi:hypothetical protein